MRMNLFFQARPPFEPRRACLPALLCLGTLSHVPARAQAAPPELPAITVQSRDDAPLTQPAAVGSHLGLTPLQTPASIEVIRREQLEERGDGTLVQAVTRAAGVSTLSHPGNGFSALSVRGFTDAASVMWLYDGVRQYGGVGITFPFGTWPVERVEVLRGPAAVLYGEGAVGGVVNIVPKKPTRGAIAHEIEAKAGTRGQRALAYGSGGALTEQLSYRLDLSGNASNGWVQRGQTRSNDFSGALQWDPNPDLMLRLSHAQGHQLPMRYFGTPLVGGEPLAALRRANYNVANSAIEFNDRWTELAARWTPGASWEVQARLYHVESTRYWRNAEGAAYNRRTGVVDRSDSTEIEHRQRQTGLSTHATWKGPLAGLPSQLSVGFDANQARFQHTNNTYAGSSGSVALFDPWPGVYVSQVPFLPRYRNEARQQAVFAESRVELGPRWSLVGGLRHDHSQLERHNLVSSREEIDRRYSHTGWRVGAVYQPQPNWSVYAQYARAADPVSGLLMLSAANADFDLSTGEQVEAGVKRSFWNGAGEWTLSGYHIRKNNLLTRDATDPSRRLQVGQRSSRGVEGTLALPLGDRLRLEANIALLRARYDDFSEAVNGVAVSRRGKVPTDVPQRLGNLWLSWKPLVHWSVSGGLRHVGSRFADNANTMKLPAYTTVDLALQWQATPATTVSLRGFNVFDRQYFTTTYYNTSQWFVGEGRRVEVSLLHRF